MWILDHLLTVVGFALCVFLIARILGSQRAPGTTLAWLLAILLIPYVGVPLYLLFGGRKLRRMVRHKGLLYEPSGSTSGKGQPAEGVGQQAWSGIADGPIARPTERVLAQMGIPPARDRNRIELLGDGTAAYVALMELIEQATESIHLMTFILGRDDVGRAVIDALARKARQGVRVRLLLDSLGCLKTRGKFVQPLREAGGEVGVFMPILPLRRKWSANLRNHRKLVVVDGRTAIAGGMNLAHEYMGPTPDPNRWIDTGVAVDGPAVADLDAVFARDWEFATNRAIDVAGPVAPAAENAPVQVAASGPDAPEDVFDDALMVAIMSAGQRIWIVTPYFVPDDALMKTLILQARLGRDVRLLVPARSNHRVADLARGRYLRQLTAAGATVHLCRRMVHAKLMVFDDQVAVIGSANVDLRSLYLNFEIALLLYGAEEVAEATHWIEHLMALSDVFVPEPVPFFGRWGEDLAALVAPLL